MVNGIADVKIIENKSIIEKEGSPKGKAFLRVTFEDGKRVDMTRTLAEMIGGVGAGTAQRLGYVERKN